MSEYDEIIKCRNTPESELSTIEVSINDYRLNKSDYPEKRLLELKEMSNEELYYFGYTDEQIAILKNYKGEPLQNVPEMKAVLSTLTISFTGIYHYTYQYRIKANWYWSTMPLGFSNNHNGTAAFVWVASGPAGVVVNSQYSSGSSFCTVWYYSGSNIVLTYNSPMSVVNPYSGVMSTHSTKSSTGWAKSGQMTLQTNSIDNGTITQMAYSFGYAHQALAVTPSISISTSGVSVDFTFSIEMTTDGKRTCTYDQYGNLTSY